MSAMCSVGEDDTAINELHCTVMEEMKSMLQKLQALWTEIGFSSSEQHQRLISLKDTVRHFYSKEESYKNTLLKKVDDNGQELFHLCRELDVHAEELFQDEGLTLIEMDAHLRRGLHDLHQQVEERRKKLNDLHRQEQELCEQLIEDPSVASGREVPSLEEISDVQRRINTLQQEKHHRSRSFRQLKSEVSALLSALDQPANTSLAHSLVHGEEQLFTLSLHNIDAITRLRNDLKDKVSSSERELERMRSAVQTLWQRLKVADDEQQRVRDRDGGRLIACLTLYRTELDRLEELKRANIARLTTSLKEELRELWERCYVGDQEREDCQAYHSTECSEDVLSQLEAEVARLQRQRAAASHLYDKLDHRTKLWNKLKELEERCNDPSRLFKNRGCALLREERERNHIKGELPRVEADLQEGADAWQREQVAAGRHPTVFTMFGYPLHEFIHDQWEQSSAERLTQIRERQTARAAQVEREARLGARPVGPVRRRGASNNTAISTRRTNVTSSSSGSSHRSVIAHSRGGHRGVLSEQHHNTPESLLPPVTSRRVRSKFNTSTVPEHFSGTATADNHEQLCSTAVAETTTYSQFSDNIAARSEEDQIRSSVMHPRSPRTPCASRTPLLVCHSPYNTPANYCTASSAYSRPTLTLPRPFRPPASLPRVALLPPTRVAPHSSTARNRTVVNATFRHTLPRNTSSIALRRTLNMNSSASRRSPATGGDTSRNRKSVFKTTPLSQPRRRSARLNAAPAALSKSRLAGVGVKRLTTPARNRLHFLI